MGHSLSMKVWIKRLHYIIVVYIIIKIKTLIKKTSIQSLQINKIVFVRFVLYLFWPWLLFWQGNYWLSASRARHQIRQYSLRLKEYLTVRPIYILRLTMYRYWSWTPQIGVSLMSHFKRRAFKPVTEVGVWLHWCVLIFSSSSELRSNPYCLLWSNEIV